MDEKTLDVYNALAEHRLQSFYNAFHHSLRVHHKRDFVLLCRSDLQCIGLLSRLSINRFEGVLKSLKNADKSKGSNFNYSEYFINTILPNQEPVIIGSGNVIRETILGSGNFGKVYKGTWSRNTQDGKAVQIPVAIKTLSDGAEMSWRKEVSIFTALNQNHSNIIKFCGLLIGDEDKLEMVTEFAALGSLLDRLRCKDITSIATLSQFSVQISSGMVFLHSKNLVHRDLSARNILVVAENLVKISDFGLSKVLDDKKKEWVMDGAESLPIRWLAPESINSGIFTSSSDVWSFAVVLWEMFTFGDSPWLNETNEQVKIKIQNGECLGEPPFCPGGVYDVMSMCFCFDSQSRPSFRTIREELIKRQPSSVVATVTSADRYDLNFELGDYVTSIKPISGCKDTNWLGQHEKTLLLGRFDTRKTRPAVYSIPYSLEDDNKTGELVSETEEKSIQEEEMMFTKKPPVKAHQLKNDSEVGQQQESFYVNMNPVADVEPVYQVPKIPSVLKSSVVENLKKEEINQQKSLRPHSEVLSSREDFFDLSSSNENISANLKSCSDSKLLFRDTEPNVQEKVNDGIAKNMSAFLTLSNSKDEKDMTSTSSDVYLSPIDVSSVVTPKSKFDSIIDIVDPFARTKSASCENVYNENAYSEVGQRLASSTSNTQFKRERPKGTLQHQEEENTPSAYRKSSLDAYARSVKKDFDLLAQRLGPKTTISSDPLPGITDAMKVSVDDLQHCSDVRNIQYLTKFDSAIPLNTLIGDNNKQEGNKPPVSRNFKAAPIDHRLQVHKPKAAYIDRLQVHNTTQPSSALSPDYYNSFILDQKFNHFTYDPKAAPNNNKNTGGNLSGKEKSRKEVSNYTDNNWDLFEDCVKDSKKFSKSRKTKPATTTLTTTAGTVGAEISWPQDTSREQNDNIEQRDGGNGKEEFSAKFQKIRSVLPEISVSECLEGLRHSDNNVQRAIRFIQIQKLTRANYGFDFQQCQQVFEECQEDYTATEKLLKTKFLTGKFQFLSENQIRDTLELCSWNHTSALKTIFVQQCRDIGINESKALSIYSACDENVSKALEKAKIVRVSEITNCPENRCFKVLSQSRWNVERAVDHILTKGP